MAYALCVYVHKCYRHRRMGDMGTLKTKINVDLVMLDVQKYPCLYDTEDASNQDAEKVRNIWREVGEVLTAPVRLLSSRLGFHHHHHHLSRSCHCWQMASTTHAMHFDFEPTSSMLSLHLLLGLHLTCFPSLGVHSVILAHLVLLILATCPAHCPLLHRTIPIGLCFSMMVLSSVCLKFPLTNRR